MCREPYTTVPLFAACMFRHSRSSEPTGQLKGDARLNRQASVAPAPAPTSEHSSRGCRRGPGLDSRILGFALAATASAWPAVAQQRINDTGQTACYNNIISTGTVSSNTPDPEANGYDQQDCTIGAAAADARGFLDKVGSSTVRGRDYTKIANDGRALPAISPLGPEPGDWGCTRDNVTGLMWEIKTTSGPRALAHQYTWYDTNAAVNGGQAGTLGSGAICGNTLVNCTTTGYRDAVNALTGSNRLCGATDWRLPTPKELSGLVAAGLSSPPMIDATWFPNTLLPGDTSGGYWTGTNAATSTSNTAWRIRFASGIVSTAAKSTDNHVRLVRGGP